MNNILIKKIEKKDIDETAIVFAEAFNFADQEKGWTKETATKYIKYWLNRRPDMFFISTQNKEITGGIIGDIKPFKSEVNLSEIVLFVLPKYHKQGIAKKLVKTIVEEAVEKYHITMVCGFADSTVKFPMEWYRRIALVKTKWVFIEGKAEEILKNLGR